MQIILNRTEVIITGAIVLFLLVKYITMYFAVSKLKKKPQKTQPKIHDSKDPPCEFECTTKQVGMMLHTPTEPTPKKKMRHPSTRFKHKITRKK